MAEAPLATAARTGRPVWLAWAPFLGRAPELDARQWRVLGLVSAATLFNQYDRALFTLALPQIQAGLGIAEGDVGMLGSLVKLGALPAFGIALVADRLGRRRVLIGTLLAYTVVTGLTALAPDARSFVALQFLAAAFTQAEVLVAVVVISEELPPEHRGWGVGALVAIQALGVGLAALLLPLVGLDDDAWRGLYAVGVAPLLLLAWWRRGLPETERFERFRAEERAARGAIPAAAGSPPAPGPLVRLARAYPGRLALLSVAVFLLATGGAAADFFSVKYLQQAHGWRPGQVTLLFLGGGAFGLCGAAAAGWLGDRFGRRPATVVSVSAVGVLALLFYQGSGAWLAPLWVAMVFFSLGQEALLSAYGAELFPTSHRTTAAGARLLVATAGGALGLAAESVLYGWLGSHWSAISVLLGLVLLAPIVVGVAFPETARRSLEAIAPERAPREEEAP